MTLKERELLEITARSLLKLEKDIIGQVAGIEAVLHALFVTKGIRLSPWHGEESKTTC